MRIAILGAECTGKTQLAQALALRLDSHDGGASWVAEALREWCALNGHTPGAIDQQAIAREQVRRVEAATTKGFLIADTTALMTAIYSDLLFQDCSLYPLALEHQRRYDLTLVMGLDLPWLADGVQRDGPQAQALVDTRLREILATHRLNYTTVYGSGEERTICALNTVLHHLKQPSDVPTPRSNWQWSCEKCSDTDCEHRLFSELVAKI